ncbi:MAG: phospholipase D-like domain-containing protein [Stagnimonas sp.]|nr:phospholipase D-like domain-containing protein [Stagnimonas sp.]
MRRHSRPKTAASLLRVLAIACLLSLDACASLPDAERQLAAQPAQSVVVEGASGQASRALGRQLMAQAGKAGDTDMLQRHLQAEQVINAGSPLVAGNRLRLLSDGPATYAAMFAAIDQARHHIHLETYIFEDGEIGEQFATRLLERERAGVQVRVLYDSVGGLGTAKEFFERLRAGGIQVVEFNPINPLEGKRKGWQVNQRDHRKLLIVDGRSAFVGGINISDSYASSPFSSPRLKRAGKSGKAAQGSGWRDTHLQIDGPVVAEFQQLFLASWAKQRGPVIAAKGLFPGMSPQGAEVVRAIGSGADEPESLIFLTLMSAIAHAEQSIHLTIAYFAPDPQLRQALLDAARRGVEVELLLPRHTDSWVIFNIGRSHYQELLDGGVKIHERGGPVMHAKTATIDGVWSTVGSTNLDWRSLLHNDELNAVVVGSDFAAQMETMFERDLVESTAIQAEQWRQRSLTWRIKEFSARLVEYWF